jgi:hypothetical protein
VGGADIPVTLNNYIEMGFNDLTPIGVGVNTLPADTDSAWHVAVFENTDLPLFVAPAECIINVNFVTDSGCIFNGSLTFNLGDGVGAIVNTPITLTKIFP